MSASLDVRIRPMAPDDADAIASLCTDLGYPATDADIATRSRDLAEGHAVLVAERERRVVGWIHVRSSNLLVSAPRAEIAGLMIDDGARRQGLGRALVEAAERWARERRLGSILVRSNVVREDAHAFYAALAYRRTKTSAVFHKDL